MQQRFAESFYFRCEADDPLNPWAYTSSINPFGSQLRTLLGSDIEHFDVPDIRRVLPEEWEPVDAGHITADDFRDFVFANPASLWTATNPDFSEGTAVEGPVKAVTIVRSS